MSSSILKQIEEQILLSQLILDLSYKQQTAVSANRIDKFIELGIEKEKLIEASRRLENLPDSYHQLSPEQYESLPSVVRENIEQYLTRLTRLMGQVTAVERSNRDTVHKRYQSIKTQIGGLKKSEMVHQTYASREEADRQFQRVARTAQYIDRKN